MLTLRAASGSAFKTVLICRVHVTTALSKMWTLSLSFSKFVSCAAAESVGGKGSSVWPLVWPIVTYTAEKESGKSGPAKSGL